MMQQQALARRMLSCSASSTKPLHGRWRELPNTPDATHTRVAHRVHAWTWTRILMCVHAVAMKDSVVDARAMIHCAMKDSVVDTPCVCVCVSV
mmetsp:Transcript_6891/g.18125  ORF Transcript_6891/g.18125 Transcript_6891/m.18125 type:complete len:93 (-) Transcript_6891:114-392(-)|eukprot:5400611-Prymnesium_polylepis.1